MTADDLSAPLGQDKPRRQRKFPVAMAPVIASALALFVCAFAVWAIVGDDPFGGEPMVAVPVDVHALASAKKSGVATAMTPQLPATQVGGQSAGLAKTAAATPEQSGQPTGKGKTVTIIDGKTGARQEIVLPAAENPPAAAPSQPLDQKMVEMTAHGPIPKIAADGTRPSEAFARPVKPIPGKPDAPRIALIVAGLGISASATIDSITKLPAAVTLAFMPYGSDIESLAVRARAAGHEILLQVPMEPFNYPSNDSGPETLLTSLTPAQNIDRLHWVMSRMQGYVGIAGAMGARFTASEQSFAPILSETAKRGLIYVDDGSNPRSVAARIAGANSLPFAKTDVVLDSVPTPTEIDHALARLEMAAREHGVAVGIAAALPVSIEHIAKWAKAAESHGLLLVPITAVTAKEKQS